MELYNKEQIADIVRSNYDDVSNGVIDRYCNHYLSRINYHNLLLGGKDKVEINIKLSPFQIKIYDFVKCHFNSRLANNLSLEVKNNKVYINGRKPIKNILERSKEIMKKFKKKQN